MSCTSQNRQHLDQQKWKEFLPLSLLRKNAVIYYFSLLIMSWMLPLRAHAAKAIPIQIGEWYLEPTIDLTIGDSRAEFIGFQEINNDKYNSIEPKIRLHNINKDREITFNYHGEKTKFKNNPEADYDSAYLAGEFKKSLSDRSDISISSEHESGSQPQGVREDIKTISAIEINQPIDFEIKNLMLKYEFYGIQNAGHNLEVSVNKESLNYKNSELFSHRERETTTFNAKWRYLWARDRGVFLNFKTSENDYLSENKTLGVDLDNQETQLVIGVEWRASENVFAEIGGGIVKKTFDNLDVDIEIPAFYGRLEAQLSKLDTLRLEAQMKPIEQAGVGIFQDYRDAELTWIRRLTPRLSMEAFYGQGDVSYELSSRVDNFSRYGILFEYRLSRTADIIVGYRAYEDDSNENQFDYNGANLFITYSTGL